MLTRLLVIRYVSGIACNPEALVHFVSIFVVSGFLLPLAAMFVYNNRNYSSTSLIGHSHFFCNASVLCTPFHCILIFCDLILTIN